ncbi:MAG TPA: beta-propeller fold lactonase family protein [Candidatus Tumulicola sp.]
MASTIAAVAGGSQPQACSAPHAPYAVTVPGRPFAVAELPSGQAAFVSVNPETPTQLPGIAVMLCRGGRFAYDHLVPLSAQPTGVAVTPDGRLLVVADDAYAAFLRTSDAVAGRPSLAGFVKLAKGDIEDESAGATFASVSPDGMFAFISDEQTDAITVIDLAKAENTRYSRDAIVGEIEVGNAPITTAFSPDGTKMYVTSEVALRKYGFPVSCRREGAPADAKLELPAGVVLSVDLAKAETDPSSSIIGIAAADCATVRLSLSPDGRFVWATNRGSNTLTQLDNSAIGAGNQAAKIASVPVGSNPVPVLATSDGRYVLVGNTNRFGVGGTTSGSISVVDAHDLRVVDTFAAGVFPRGFYRGVGTTVFLANNRSDSIDIFDERMVHDCVAHLRTDCSLAPNQ